MSNRFSRQNPSQNDLFSTYNRSASPSKSKSHSRSRPAASPYASYSTPAPEFGAYPGAANGSGNGGAGVGIGVGGYRSATPNSRGQYSAATLDELESQNDEHAGALISKVRMLKDLTTAIGAEIRDSTALADGMNDQFDASRARLRGTMNRMLRMAERTGVGWRVWVAFFAAVCVLFWWVWLG